MISGLALVLLSILPRDDVQRVSVDLVEINHYYDDQGRPIFTQAIFYDWSWADRRFQVRAWRLVKQPSLIPVWDWETRRWVSLWLDGDQCRKVYAAHQRETWTQEDPELLEREVLPKERRKELSAGSGRKPSR